MPVNLNKPKQWKADIVQSVDMYNGWFMKFAPQAFRTTRVQTTRAVEAALRATGNLSNIQPALMREHPEVLPTLRMSTCPPLAVDRLIGLAGVSTNLVKCMELERKLPARGSLEAPRAERAPAAASRSPPTSDQRERPSEKWRATRMEAADVELQLAKIATIIEKMADPDIFVWLGRAESASQAEVHRAATIVADRLCGAVAN
ncbi:MAG TPA: XamI family restriction endonuclease, partial [Stellaceae bacterium]|nr:XamI family restriction endonuclease [Stellaceae bacterium]